MIATTNNTCKMIVYQEGYGSYISGKFLYENPYRVYGDADDQPEYYDYLDGWFQALVDYPESEPKEIDIDE